MNKTVRMISFFLTACFLLFSASAARNIESYGEVSIRTGPGKNYAKICSLPKGRTVRALEYEENGSSWHFVEFYLNGELTRGYIKNSDKIGLDSASGYTEANHSGQQEWWVAWNEVVYAAPSRNAGYRGYVFADDEVTVLEEDGDYLYIEFLNQGEPCRGYISSYNRQGISSSYGSWNEDFDFYYDLTPVPAKANEKLFLRTGPGTDYEEIQSIPQSTQIKAIERVGGNGVVWVLLEYSRNGKTERAYTGMKRITAQSPLPWEYLLGGSGQITQNAEVYAAPSSKARVRDRLDGGEHVTVLRYEGDYAYVEYRENGLNNRGYVERRKVDVMTLG